MGAAVLEASFLGGFSLQYDHRPLDVLRTGNSQFVSLLQLVLHNLDGTRQQDLQDALFGGRRESVEDLPHAIRSVVYNANARLEQAGIPGRPNIIQKKGTCCWAGNVPVSDDARAFEAAASDALVLDGPDRVDGLEKACLQYPGTFLDGYSGALWIVSEARRYKAMFHDCASKARDLMREASEWERLHALGLHAASACPLSGWENVCVEALCAMGRHSEAMALYDSAAKKYFSEQGVKLAIPAGLGGQEGTPEWHWAGTPLSSVMTTLDNTDKTPIMGYVPFLKTYKTLGGLSWRTGMSLYLMSCTVYDRKGNLLRPGPVMDRVVMKLSAALDKALRSSDVACHCGGGRFLALLPDITLEDCELVRKRICNIFYEKGRSMRLEFDVLPAPGPEFESGTPAQKGGGAAWQ